MKNHNKYVIEAIERMNIRYYKIEIDGKWYVVDYSNPQDIRNYFPGLFPDVQVKWKMYDAEPLNYPEKIKKKKYHSKVRWDIVFFFLYLSEFHNSESLSPNEFER
ncbi:hypothetical protein [Amphibacillus jilinensis]|uniref:hypothetical protein n=1 Tax=Amphibacillus jilinensis TaxID=1216008 RepID=UPI0003697257|nr:hypothetical protein [Amphibacillus jilinensis]